MMDSNNFTDLITYLAITSVAAERLTDIFKKAWLSKINVNSYVYQAIAAIFGGSLAFYIPPDLHILQFNEYVRAVVVGLAVSGGSGVWHDLLSTLANYKEMVQKKNSLT